MTVCVMQVSLEVRVTVGTFSPSPCPLFPICFLTLSPLDQDNNKNGFCFKILLFNNIKNLLKNNALLFDNIHLLWTYGLFLECYETQQLVQPATALHHKNDIKLFFSIVIGKLFTLPISENPLIFWKFIGDPLWDFKRSQMTP